MKPLEYLYKPRVKMRVQVRRFFQVERQAARPYVRASSEHAYRPTCNHRWPVSVHVDTLNTGARKLLQELVHMWGQLKNTSRWWALARTDPGSACSHARTPTTMQDLAPPPPLSWSINSNTYSRIRVGFCLEKV